MKKPLLCRLWLHDWRCRVRLNDNSWFTREKFCIRCNKLGGSDEIGPQMPTAESLNKEILKR